MEEASAERWWWTGMPLDPTSIVFREGSRWAVDSPWGWARIAVWMECVVVAAGKTGIWRENRILCWSMCVGVECSWALVRSKGPGLVVAAAADAAAVAVVEVCSIEAVEHQRIDEIEPETVPEAQEAPSGLKEAAGTAVTVALAEAAVVEEEDSRTPEQRTEPVAVLNSSNHLPCPSCWHSLVAQSASLDGTSLE